MVRELLQEAARHYEAWLETEIADPVQIAKHLIAHRMVGLIQRPTRPVVAAAMQIHAALKRAGANTQPAPLQRDLLPFWERKLYLKGYAYQRFLYCDDFQRVHTDVDVLIDAQEKQAFFEMLSAEGWTPHDTGWRHPNCTQSTWLQTRAVRKCFLDVHWRISSHPVLCDSIVFNDAYDRASVCEQSGLRWLGVHGALLHSSIHYLASEADHRSDLNLLDIYVLAGSRGKQVDQSDRQCLESPLFSRVLTDTTTRFGGHWLGCLLDPDVELRLSQRLDRYERSGNWAKKILFGYGDESALRRIGRGLWWRLGQCLAHSSR